MSNKSVAQECQLTPFELEAVNLIAQSRDFADRLEAMLVTILEHREKQSPAKAAPISHVTDSGIHVNIAQLIAEVPAVTWDTSLQSVAELRNYAFMEIASKEGSEIGFKYLTSKFPKVNFQKRMNPEVFKHLEVGKVYIIHTTKKNGRNHWDMAIDLPYSFQEIQSRARMLSRFFATAMATGQI